jgi:hypothetical protein
MNHISVQLKLIVRKIRTLPACAQRCVMSMSIDFQFTVSPNVSLFENVLSGLKHRREKIIEAYKSDAASEELVADFVLQVFNFVSSKSSAFSSKMNGVACYFSRNLVLASTASY